MPARISRSLVPLVAALAVAAGCATAQVGPQTAADNLKTRTGAAARVTAGAKPGVPDGVTLEDGLTRDEAVALALWNNADFQTSVADFGFARADLLEAGLLTNPVLSLLYPLGPKQFESTLKWPIEVLWERPRRVASARKAADAAGERLVQTGLDLVLSVKVAYADAALADDRVRLAGDTAALLERIDGLTRSRLDAGDISALEARAATIDASRARQEAARLRHDAGISRDRLRALLGFAIEGPAIALAGPAAAAVECGPVEALMREAIVSRPDVRAAELSVESAAARLGWEKSRVLALTAVLDANGSGKEGFEMGPGTDITLPLFNRNQAGRARASATLQRAAAAYTAAQQRAAAEIREASALVAQAVESKASWRKAITLPLESNLAEAEQSFKAGEVSYLFVLENSRRLADARLREREIDAELQRAQARIERAIGRTCGTARQEITRGF